MEDVELAVNRAAESIRSEYALRATGDPADLLRANKLVTQRHKAEALSRDDVFKAIVATYRSGMNGQQVADVAGYSRAYINRVVREREALDRIIGRATP